MRRRQKKKIFALVFVMLISQAIANENGSGDDQDPTDADSENGENLQDSEDSQNAENKEIDQPQSENSTLRKTLEEMEPENVTNILAQILTGYSVQERPYYRVKPTEIQIRFDIASISHISEENMEFKAGVYFTQVWFDPRLVFNKANNNVHILLRINDIFKVWLPDTYISNARKYTIDPYTPTVKIYGDGLVEYSYLLSVTLQSRMNFLYYPMDHQILHLDIYSYMYDNNQLRLSWDRGSVLMQDIAAFVVKKVDKIEEVHQQGQFDFSFLSFRITVRRRLRYFLLQFFFPCILCALVSCLPFWMDRYEIGERLALGITTLLTEVFLSQYINSSMPRVSYIKAADEYLLATFIFIFGALLESVVVYNYRPDVLARKEEEKTSNKKTNKKTAGCFNRETVSSDSYNDNFAVQSTDEVTGIEMVFFDEDSSKKNNKNNNNSNGHTATINDDKTNTDEPTTKVSTKDKSLLIDQLCRFFFPLVYLGFQGYYFGRYLPDFYRGYK